MNSRVSANVEVILSALVLLGYFLFAPTRPAFAPNFAPLAWIPYILMLAAFAYLDRHYWATLRISRMVLLERNEKIDNGIVQDIQTVLIPNRVAPFMPLYQILFVTAFSALLFYQGWLTAILAFAVALLWGLVTAAAASLFPAASAVADRRSLKAIRKCLERRTLPKPGEIIIPGISRLELLFAVDEALQHPLGLQTQYMDSLRRAQQEL